MPNHTTFTTHWPDIEKRPSIQVGEQVVVHGRADFKEVGTQAHFNEDALAVLATNEMKYEVERAEREDRHWLLDACDFFQCTEV